jgi:uncharacterized protein YcfJ
MANDNYFHVSKRGVTLTLAAIGFLIVGAALASYYGPNATQTAQTDTQDTAKKATHHSDAAAPVHHQQVAQAQPACNDHNIVGTGVGGVAGGILGSQFGRGSGKTATTIGGALGGAYLGNQYIPTQNATCK